MKLLSIVIITTSKRFIDNIDKIFKRKIQLTQNDHDLVLVLVDEILIFVHLENKDHVAILHLNLYTIDFHFLIFLLKINKQIILKKKTKLFFLLF
jgi:hypothetical protein